MSRPAPTLLKQISSDCITGLPRKIAGNWELELMPHSRLPPADVGAWPYLHAAAGVLAFETVPPGGRRQVLDFLMPGDVIPTVVATGTPSYHIRAVTRASLRGYDSSCPPGTQDNPLQERDMLGRMCAHLARRNLHDIMIGQLEAEARAASFLIALAIRTHGALLPACHLALPMSRDDIADYLVINPDTLSRIMTRFETLGAIERHSRHAVTIVDPRRLLQRTPLRPQAFDTHATGTRKEVGPPKAGPTGRVCEDVHAADRVRSMLNGPM